MNPRKNDINKSADYETYIASLHIWDTLKMSETTITNTNNANRTTGCVKWFNNKAGFGFVTACEGELNGKDVFVHYSSIRVPSDQYKYLIQGEYVHFDIAASDKSEHEFHAVNVSGINGGSLMCETRNKLTNETKLYKHRVYKTPDETDQGSLRKKRGPSKHTSGKGGGSSSRRGATENK